MIEPGRSGHRNRAVARHAARQVSTKKNGFRLTWILSHAKVDKPAYPLSYNGAGEGLAPAPPSNPPLFALPRRSRMGAPPPFPRVAAA